MRLFGLAPALRLFGDRPWPRLLLTSRGATDYSWNMLAVSPQLHVWWGQGLWAVKCLGITPVNNKHTLTLEFNWMPKRSALYRGRGIRLDKGEGQKMLDELTTWNGDPSAALGTQGIVSMSDARSHQPLKSGQVFHVSHDTKQDAEDMRDMINLQWYLITASALAGAADPPELEGDESEDDIDPLHADIDLDANIQQWLEGLEAAPFGSGQSPSSSTESLAGRGAPP